MFYEMFAEIQLAVHCLIMTKERYDVWVEISNITYLSPFPTGCVRRC